MTAFGADAPDVEPIENGPIDPMKRLYEDIEAQRRSERDINLDGARQFAIEARNRGDSFVWLWFRVKSRMSPWVIFIRVWGIQARVVKREYRKDEDGYALPFRFCAKFNVIEILEAYRRRQLREMGFQARPVRRVARNRLPRNVMIR